MPIAIIIASGVELDLIVGVIRARFARHDAAPLRSWASLLEPVAQEHHRILAGQLAEKWLSKLASLDADARNSPTARRMLAAVSMAAPRRRADASGASPASRTPGTRKDAPAAPASPTADLDDDLVPSV